MSCDDQDWSHDPAIPLLSAMWISGEKRNYIIPDYVPCMCDVNWIASCLYLEHKLVINEAVQIQIEIYASNTCKTR